MQLRNVFDKHSNKLFNFKEININNRLKLIAFIATIKMWFRSLF